MAVKNSGAIVPAQVGPLAVALLVATGIACGSGTRNDTCIQIGPPAGYPLRQFDLFIATGHPQGTPAEVPLLSFYGFEIVGLSPSMYEETCFTSRASDRPNYRWVGWVDDFKYRDGGQAPTDTYCADSADAGCAPQPGQPHGEVVVTFHEGANNLVIIPMSP